MSQNSFCIVHTICSFTGLLTTGNIVKYKILKKLNRSIDSHNNMLVNSSEEQKVNTNLLETFFRSNRNIISDSNNQDECNECKTW